MRSRDGIATITDLFVQPRDTRCLERDGYQVVRTESMPSYQMGNYMILDQPPDPGDIDSWLARCWHELGDLPIQKCLLLWETEAGTMWPPHGTDGTDGADGKDGKEPPRGYQSLVVLSLDMPPQPPSTPQPADIVFRPVEGDREWRMVPELSVATFEKEIPGYAEFVRWRYDQFRRRLADNAGHVWGAWHGDMPRGAGQGARTGEPRSADAMLVASLGLISAPAAMRFQEVQTHPAYRRRGLCTALCTHALRHHMAAEPGKPAIIVAEAGSQAERIYRRIGFTEIGRQHVLEHGVPGQGGEAKPDN